MPGPVSRTLNPSKASPAGPLSRVTWTCTSPRPVNLMALPIKFNSTCRTRAPSVSIKSGTSVATCNSSLRAFRRADSPRRSTVSPRHSRTSTAWCSSSNLPDSIFEKSKMSLIIASSASLLPRTVRNQSRCSVVKGVSNNKLVKPITAFIGVRISWLMTARNSLLAWLPRLASKADCCADAIAASSWPFNCSDCSRAARSAASFSRHGVISTCVPLNRRGRPARLKRALPRAKIQRHVPSLWCMRYSTAYVALRRAKQASNAACTHGQSSGCTVCCQARCVGTNDSVAA